MFTGWGGPAIVGDSVYLPSKKGADNASLRVFNAFTGSEQGRFTARNEPVAIYGTPLVVDLSGGRMIYTTSVYRNKGKDYGRVYAVKEGDLSVRAWEFPSQGQNILGPIFGGVAYSKDTNTVYFCSADGKLYGLNADDGSPKLGASGVIFPANSPIWGTPAVSKGVVYFGTMGGTLFGVKESGGKVLEFKTGGAIAATPVVEDGTVYVGSFNKKFYAVDPSGRARWSFSTDNWVWAEALLAQDLRGGKVLFVGSLDGKLYALDATSGKMRWFFETQQGILGKPALASRNIVSGPYESLSDKVLVVGSRDGRVYGLDPVTGKPYWQKPFNAKDRVLASITSQNNVVYVSNTDHELFAIDASTGQTLQGWFMAQ